VQALIELANVQIALADAAGARTMLREIDAIVRRRPALGVLIPEVGDLRVRVSAVRTNSPGFTALTNAEMRLLPLLATHLPFPGIAQQLFLSKHTIKTQAISIYRKLGVTSRGEAVARAREFGLLDEHPLSP
jgi:LuxR family transcriptional regulator, maltose regulon positive regulatory protein